MQTGDVAFNDRAYKNEDRDLTSKVMEPRWDQLKCQAIRLALQIHMQHLHVTNPHRWSLPEKAVAVQYTIRQTTQPKMRKDYMSTFLQKLLRASQSNVTQGASKATRRTRPYLGAVLSLTRIVYHALERAQLPKPWGKPDSAKIGSKTAPGSRPPQKTKKPVTPRKEEFKDKPTTRSATAQQQDKPTEEPTQKTEAKLEEEMLLRALELSHSEAGTSSQKISSQEPASLWNELEEIQLREALKRNVRETHISQEGLSGKMISSLDGVMYSEKDMAIVHRILIDFNQDPEAVCALHGALELL